MYLSKLFNIVLMTISKYKIDESHGIIHAMNVLHNCDHLIDSVIQKQPEIEEHRKIIYSAAILHDMCDKKYMNEDEGMKEIKSYIYDSISNTELDVMENIVSTMSYSKVKKKGFPELGQYQTAYHVVREGDLLAAYDFDRCMIYHMTQNDANVHSAFQDAYNLFQTRIFKHQEDGLLLFPYSNEQHIILSGQAHIRIQHWRKMLSYKL
jgi:HD superfamily phosphodiesterase